MADLRGELQTIYNQHGYLTPELVVETARPEDHPLHPRIFDKNEHDAAEAYYRDRAHELIRSYTVQYTTRTGSVGRVRQWHAVETPSGHVYKTADDIAADPLLSEIALRTMEREWRQLLTRYERFAEFASMVLADLTPEAAA